ncbi:ferredoxin-NADPH reductase [Cryobacterium lactosi]|uniref:Ferredoxin-NADPH reductase n=1 Tax=Cryobacterium lactosi TaxID=1259202 RepID=A0A4R9BZA4_9MICO|nr:ferredoxin-NADPH reductase [Cryobacterium lactosi]TFD93308.1 ferredoxin-NADPH reductase [Cryobacterium lactosi]
MKPLAHGTFTMITGVLYLALITNVLLVVAGLPLVLLLITTDPARSWPLLALTAPFCTPGVSAAFATFREFSRGGATPARAFLAGWLTTWRRAFQLGALVTAVVVVLLVDLKFFADSTISVAVVPVLGVLTVLVIAVGLISLVAIADTPGARLGDVIRASLYLGVRRWYLTVVSLLMIGTQIALFTSMPAIALGLTMAPAFYLAWANSRYTLRPVLTIDDVPALAPGRS